MAAVKSSINGSRSHSRRPLGAVGGSGGWVLLLVTAAAEPASTERVASPCRDVSGEAGAAGAADGTPPPGLSDAPVMNAECVLGNGARE